MLQLSTYNLKLHLTVLFLFMAISWLVFANVNSGAYSRKIFNKSVSEGSVEILYQQKVQQQQLTNIIFIAVILGMFGVTGVYYRQKRKQQKINLMLEEKNREIAQQKNALDEQVQKLNELNLLKNRLMAVLAHDLRSPLNDLRGLFSLLADETISHQQMTAMLPGLLKKLDYTSDFLDTLLLWINSQMENFENAAKSFFIKDIVAREIENHHEQALLKSVALIDNVPDDLIAFADQDSIRIVIRNLVTNAIKFSKQNDVIEIKGAGFDGQNHIITVKDSGIGITTDQLDKLFKHKVNSKKGTCNEPGTGMGLMFCKDLVEQCGGKIWAASKPGHGTEFSFTLPAGTINECNLELVG